MKIDSTIAMATKELSQADPVIAELISKYGPYTVRPHTDYYQTLVDSIISQQLSVKAARAIEARFCMLFGSGSFPLPEKILEKTTEELRSTGLSRPKIRYIQDLAMKVLEGSLQLDKLGSLTNQEVIIELTKVTGIGIWTAHMFLIFSLGRLDVLAYGDLGIRNGIRNLYGFDDLPTQLEIEAIARTNNWSPHESIACWYIWRSLENKP